MSLPLPGQSPEIDEAIALAEEFWNSLPTSMTMSQRVVILAVLIKTYLLKHHITMWCTICTALIQTASTSAFAAISSPKDAP